ncbi:hypothetical protein CHUAL_010949 [Chamberlinius hualienensis]
MESNEGYNNLLSWMQTEAPFRGYTNPIFINGFLNMAKNDVEVAKEKVTKYYTMRKSYPDILRAVDLLEEKCLRGINLGVLSTDIGLSSDIEFPVVMVADLGRASLDYDLNEALNMAMNIAVALLFGTKRIQKHGLIMIMDLSQIPYGFLIQITPPYLAKIMKLINITGTLKQLHIINTGYVVRVIIETARLLVPTMINDLIYVHNGSWDVLAEYIPPECLPVEFGGTNGTQEENIADTREAVLNLRDFILENDQYGFSEEEETENDQEADDNKQTALQPNNE